MKVKHALVIPDCHIPYHDERAYNLMLKVAKDLSSVDEVVILGDYADFYSVSSYPKDPNVSRKLVEEVNEVNDKLDELDTLFPKANKIFIEGNHEDRLTRYVRDQARDLFGLVDSRTLFRLNDRKNWKWIEYGPQQKVKVLNSHLYARHEPVGSGQNCASSTVSKCGSSVIFGHVHRIQEHQTVMLDGKNHRGICCGWLGNVKSPVMNYVKGHQQWALGFNIVTVLPNKSFYAQTIHIIDYKCVYGGKVYSN